MLLLCLFSVVVTVINLACWVGPEVCTCSFEWHASLCSLTLTQLPLQAYMVSVHCRLRGWNQNLIDGARTHAVLRQLPADAACDRGSCAGLACVRWTCWNSLFLCFTAQAYSLCVWVSPRGEWSTGVPVLSVTGPRVRCLQRAAEGSCKQLPISRS